MSRPSITPPAWILFSPILLLGVLSVLVLISQRNKKPPDDAWKGIFYSNPDDPALLVPKRFGIGYTLNFGNPWSWGLLVLMILIAAAPFLWLSMHRIPR
jgi:uncharacterized membrane protein